MPARQFITALMGGDGFPAIPGILFAGIERFPGYAFGAEGSVWNRWKLGAVPRVLGDVWRQLTPTPGGYKRRYREVSIRATSDAKRKGYLVHRLILEAFVGDCPPGLEGCHENGKHADNRIENLRWDTPAGNTADKIRHGTVARGSGHTQAKLDEAKVTAIRIARRAGVELETLAVEHDIDVRNIGRAARGETWKHVTEPPA